MLYPCVMHLITAFIKPQSGTQSLLLMFFVLGGYVSARKPLALMQSTDYRSRAELIKTLSTSSFRRAFRLFLPAFASTLITAAAAYAGLFELVRPYVAKEAIEAYFPGSHAPDPVRRFETPARQLQYWLYDVAPMTNIWTTKRHVPRHNHFLWTLQSEFASSIHLYVTLVVCVRLKPWARLLTLLFISQYHMIAGKRYEVMLFLWGAAMAQGELILKTVAPSSTHKVSNMTFLVKNIAWSAALYTSVVLMFYPPPILDQQSYAGNHAVVRLLDVLTPATYPDKDKLYDGLGVVLLLICIMVSSPESYTRRAFTNKYAQYFGHMFFGTILVQGIVLNAGGYLVPHFFWGWFSDYQQRSPDGWLAIMLDSPKSQTIAGLGVGELVNVPVAVLLGDLFMRIVVKRCMIVMFLVEDVVFMSDAEAHTTTQSIKPAHKVL